MNINQNINKLLYALKIKGQLYRINSFKFYSENKEKYSTKYQILKEVPRKKYNIKTDKHETIYKYEVQEEYYNQVEILKYLMEEYRKMG